MDFSKIQVTEKEFLYRLDNKKFRAEEKANQWVVSILLGDDWFEIVRYEDINDFEKILLNMVHGS